MEALDYYHGKEPGVIAFGSLVAFWSMATKYGRSALKPALPLYAQL